MFFVKESELSIKLILYFYQLLVFFVFIITLPAMLKLTLLEKKGFGVL